MIKRLTIDHALCHMLYQAMAGIAYGYTVFLLIARGFSASTAGISMFLANITSVIIQPIVSNYLDRTRRKTFFETICVTAILMFTLFLSSCFIENGNLLLIITYSLSIGIYSSLEPLFNSLCSMFQNNGLPIEFGRARALGSFSYGVVCYIFGILTEKYSYLVVLYGGIIITSAIVIVAFAIRRNYYKAQKSVIEQNDDTEVIGFFEFVRENKMYILLCVFLTGVFFSYTLMDNFTILIVENVGGNAKDMGTILGIKATLEATFIFFYSKVRKRIKLEELLIISMVGFAAKSCVVWHAKDILAIYIAQVLQVFSFAIIIPAMVEYINTNMEDYIVTRAQALFTLTIVFGGTISSLVGGMMFDNYGVSTTMLIGLIVIVVSAIGFIVLLQYQRRKQIKKG